MAKKFTISAAERLKSRKKIDELFRSGRKFSNGPFRISFDVTSGRQGMQFGIGVGTRNFKKATDRNRIKRLTRENWRLLGVPLRLLLNEQNRSLQVFVIYTGRELPDYQQVNIHFSRIIETLQRLLHETDTPHT